LVTHRYALALALLLVACDRARSPHDLQRDSPLGPSFWLVAVPSEDAGLLGRVFVRPPDSSFTLEEQSEPNPCDGVLSPAAPADMRNHYENAIQVSASAEGRALLGAYGFAGDAQTASHLLYNITTAKKLTRLDTSAYVECCKTQQCGWGYVSALVYGEGEYVSARSSRASGSAQYQLVSAQGKTSYEALDKKQIHGWLAAVITAHDRRTAVHPCALDSQWAGYECIEKDQVPFMRDRCGTNGAEDPIWRDNPQMQYMERQRQADACRWLDAHGLARPAPMAP
jgi:hypothetical protein